MLYYLFAFLLLLAIVVFIHELGHYVFARYYGVKVEVFSIGFGKEICSWYDKNNTNWRICLIPLGGYVKMFGEENMHNSMPKMSKARKKISFCYQPLSAKAIIVIGGPLFNYLTALLIFFALGVAYGKSTITTEITQVLPNSPASQAGLMPEDRVLAINGEQVTSFGECQSIIMLNNGNPLIFTIERQNKQSAVLINPQMTERITPTGDKIMVPVVGIVGEKIIWKQLNWRDAAVHSFTQCYQTSVLILKTLWQMLTGARGLQDIGGPIQIAKYSGHSLSMGGVAFLSFIALISINLAVFNLLPIPMLDGGHLLFYVLEALCGKVVISKIKQSASIIGMYLLFALMAVAIGNDIWRLFQ